MFLQQGIDFIIFLMANIVVVDMLFNVSPIVCGGSVFVFVLLCITLCLFQFCNHIEKKGRVGCYAFIT